MEDDNKRNIFVIVRAVLVSIILLWGHSTYVARTWFSNDLDIAVR